MPLPTLKDLKEKGIKKPQIQGGRLETTRARPTKEKVEGDLEERDHEINLEDAMEAQEEVIKIVLDENKDLTKADIFKLIRDDVRNNMAGKKTTTAKTNQPIRRVREATEDVYSTLQLRELINDFRSKSKDKEEEPQSNNNMAYMMPFLQKMQNGGGNAGNIDPTMLMLLMANQGNKGGGDLNQLMMMMMLMNANAQPQQDASGNPIFRGGVNQDNMKYLMEQLQSIMKSQEQKPAIDPTLMLVLQMMNKQSHTQPQQNNMKDIATLITALKSTEEKNSTPNLLLEMMRQNMDLQNQRVISMIPQEPPEDRVMRNFSFFKDLQGDTRSKTEAEMDFSLRKQEMLLGEQQRVDMLDREERAAAREDAKSDRTLSLVNTVADKVIGNGLGQLVGDLVGARAAGKKEARGQHETDDFDASILDEF